MNDKTLEALKGSIKKWEEIAAGLRENRGAADCPLCQLFNANFNYCVGCPVYEKTGQDSCKNTPFIDYCNSRSKENALREVDFLSSLLPSETDAALHNRKFLK